MKLQKRSEETGESIDSGTVEEVPKSRKQRQDSVLVYIVALFSVVLVLLVLSYFVQQKRSSSTIESLNREHTEFSVQALQNIEELQDTNRDLTDRLKAAQAESETLKTEKDALAATLEDAEAELKEAKNAALEQEKKALALSYYADLTDALRRGDFDAAAQASVRLAGMKSWLDDKYLAGYQEFLDSLNPQPEPEEETENTEEEGENHD